MDFLLVTDKKRITSLGFLDKLQIKIFLKMRNENRFDFR